MLARRDTPALRLFAFPHAGGNANGFAGWATELPADVELISYTLPRPGWQPDRPAHQDWRSLVDDLVQLVDRHDDGTPFAFFGHSFGALVAFEVCRRLIAADRRTPSALLLSAHRAPHLPPGQDWHALPAERLLDQVRAWGLVPEEHLSDDQLLQLMLPPLLNDLRLDQDYRCRTGDATGDRLAVPCVVYGGADDPTVHPDELHAWREHFELGSPFEVEILPGGHFYSITSRDALLRSVGAWLDRVRAELGPSISVTAGSYPTPELGVWDRFQQQVAANPDATALLDPPRRWSYRELSDSATALAGQLASLGVEQGAVVGLLLKHSAEYCISLLTCFGMGTPACLLEKNWPPSLLSQFLDSAGVQIVLTTPELVELLPAAFRTSDRLLVLDPERPLRRPEDPVAFPVVRPSDVALISMTSGTSGTPKAVLNTHLGCLYCFDARYELYPYQDASRDGLNVFFGWECLRPLLQGKAGVVIPDDRIFDPVRLVDALAEFRITRIVVPPSLFESVLDHPAVGPLLAERLSHLQIVFLMGEVVPARVVAKAAALLPPGARLVNAYSTWESLDVSYADLLPAGDGEVGGSGQFAPVGHILPGSAAVLLNDLGDPVPYGAVGELYVAGPGVATGYLNDPVKTAERFVACPPGLRGSSLAGQTLYRTGDLARFLPGGDLEILGRTGDVVKVRGFKVSLRAVEQVLADQPEVARVIVRPALDSRTRQPVHLLAYVLGDQGEPSETTLARLRHKARRELPEYARPRHFIGLDELPFSRGDSRKLDLAALPPPPEEPASNDLAEDDLGSDPSGRPLSTLEQRIGSAWRDVLGLRSVEPDDNFFEVGGDSLSAARLSGLLAQRYGIALAVIDVFQFSTLREMARHCSAGPSPGRVADRSGRAPRPATTKLAVVGMAGRFPGAPDIEAFWQNLLDGTDSLTTFSAERLRGKGVPEEVLAHPGWIPAAQLLADVDKFDAEFCGLGHREATLMDPQHRVFIEVAWAALEQAGYARRDNPYRRRTGVFAACGIDGYLIHHLDGGGLREPLDPGAVFLTEIGNEKDYIATRVAYLLDLGGPALTVTSACSSALVAIAQAADSIMSGQCDMAIAGASSINFPNFGYRYEEGLVGSADGHVRPFDEAASGTLFGDAVGAVVLKRLDDAIADGDLVWAVLTGFGLSNDGRMKAGYTAPSARAQAQCISDAIAMAGIGSEQISYVECHATATHIGDAIEIKGLADAFAEHRRGAEVRAGSCALGSVKGNIGHANCAAGITGFIKTVLCLHHRTLVPTANYRTLNPKLVDYIDCAGSPFTLPQSSAEWDVADPELQLPRRAGVSSFGIGGTNAHVILEEPPELPPEVADPASLHLVTVSGRSRTAFERNASALTDYLAGLPQASLGSAIRTLQARRESHSLRASAVLDGRAADRAQLSRLAEAPIAARQERAATVVFCFSGQGSQTAGMARGLYRGRADGGRFREHFDAACQSLALHVPQDPAALILGADEESVKRPVTTQCGLFAVEYALARTLTDLGVRPVAVAGHSIGEYAAAVTAELLTLDEAAALVAVRASATEQLVPPGTGGMLSVVGPEDRLADWLADRAGIWLAVENAPGRVVLSGAVAALREAATELPGLGFTCRPVPVSHPFHSALMAPVAERLGAAAAGLTPRLPAVPMASNLSGSWLDARYQASRYWGEHLTSKVRWRDAVDALLKWEPDIFLEIGPGDVLTTLVATCLRHRDDPRPLPLATMPGSKKPGSDDEADLLAAIGQLWCRGVEVDLAALRPGDRPGASRPTAHRLPPTYSFDRTSYWSRPEASIYVDPVAASSPAGQDGSAATPSRTLVRFVAKPAAQLKLYCFPYAGGNSGAFRFWAQAAPDWLDVVAVELPGRSGRSGARPPATDQDDVTVLAELAAAIRADAGSTAAAFCGLSFGAAVLFDLLSGPLADWAGSGRVGAISVVGRAALSPTAGAVEAPVEEYLMAPDEVRQDPRWQQETLPLLEADLGFDARAQRRVAQRQVRQGVEVVECPLQVHCGTSDPSFPAETAMDWAAVTSSRVVEVRQHPGSHDFMLRRRDDILAQLVSFLDRLVPLPDRPTGQLLHELRWTPAPPRTAVAGSAAQIPWMAFDPVDPAVAARFLTDQLASPQSTAALVCRLSDERTPAEHCARFLQLSQEAVRADVRGTLVLLLPARDASGLVAGLTRSLTREEPGLVVQRLHIHDWPADDGDGWVDRMVSRARACPDEVDLLVRGGHLLVQRLLPSTLPALPPKTLGAVEGSYLVTGGGGGIGQAVVDWLIHQQQVTPDRVVVAGRSQPAALRRGVRFLPLDLAHPPDAASAATEIGPLAGVFHLAGVLDDGMLRNLDAARFAGVLAPKLAVPWLAEVGRLTGAPWIVAFSSTSALLGAAGQANYAAANGWLQARAMWPEAGGSSLVSIDWGTWREVGMAARSAKALDSAAAEGETALSTGDALSQLGKVVGSVLAGSGVGNVAVCDLDWSRDPWVGMPLVSELSPPEAAVKRGGAHPSSPKPSPSPSPSPEPDAGAVDRSGDRIHSFLSDYVHRWDESTRLADLGLDSLDFARIRGDFARQFGKDVPLAAIAHPEQRLGQLYSLLSAYQEVEGMYDGEGSHAHR